MAYEPFITHHSGSPRKGWRWGPAKKASWEVPQLQGERVGGGGDDRPGGSSPIPHLTAAPIYYILVFGQLWENDWRVSFYYNIHHFINLIFCDIL